jgi:methylenetetrahydrofolate reductase (NADPH)
MDPRRGTRYQRSAVRICDRLQHKRPVFSFEFFPPKTAEGERVFHRSMDQLARLEPDFVSVTYGAGGSTRAKTIELVSRIKRDHGVEAMAHLTCVGSTRDEIAGILDQLAEAGVENVLALRGDPPKGQGTFEATPGGFASASELVAFIRERGGFCIGAACYPEVHPEATSAEADLEHLARKVDAGADFLVTQLFFDNAAFFDFKARCDGRGIRVPILPGIMPITNVAQIRRFTEMCGASIPEPLARHLAELEDDAHEVFWAGVQWAAHQCKALLAPPNAGPFEHVSHGVPGLHFYTLNKSPATRALFEILRLARATIG